MISSLETRRGRKSGNIALRALRITLLLPLLTWIGTRGIAQEIESFPKPDAAIHGDVKNGKRLYDAYGCYECHGGQGQGSPLSGPRVAPETMPFTGFARYIRKPSGQMPPYTSKVTTDGELMDIYAFLRSIPPPTDAKKIPLLAVPFPEKKK